jgi:NADH:ubiquinone oxidoreductase subunit 6 (subunit J)
MRVEFLDSSVDSATWLQRIGLTISLALALMLIVEPASAQSVQAFTTWALGPTMLGGLIGLGMALVGGFLMFGQHSFIGIFCAIVGAILIGNATQVGGFFGGGG